jgi:hypothetical protein
MAGKISRDRKTQRQNKAIQKRHAKLARKASAKLGDLMLAQLKLRG